MHQALMDDLAGRLEKLRSRYGTDVPPRVVAQAVVDPMLRGLGWDTGDVDQVSVSVDCEFAVMEYVLAAGGNRIAVSISPGDITADGHEWATDMLEPAEIAGASWCLVTDGGNFEIWRSHPSHQWPFRSFRIERGGDPSMLQVLSRDSVAADALGVAYSVERDAFKVRNAFIQALTDGTIAAALCLDIQDQDVMAHLRNIGVTVGGVDPFATVDAPPGPCGDGDEEQGGAGQGEGGPGADEGAEENPAARKKKPRSVVSTLRPRMVRGIEACFGRALSKAKGLRSCYENRDAGIVVYVRPSKLHRKNGRRSGKQYYWYSLRPEFDALADEAEEAYVAFGMGDSEEFFLVPYSSVLGFRDRLNPSLDVDGQITHWHAFIVNEGGQYWIARSDSGLQQQQLLRLDDFSAQLGRPEEGDGWNDDADEEDERVEEGQHRAGGFRSMQRKVDYAIPEGCDWHMTARSAVIFLAARGDRFVVLPGSVMSKDANASLRAADYRMRRELAEGPSMVRREDGNFEVVEEIPVSSPSAASTLFSGMKACTNKWCNREGFIEFPVIARIDG